VIEKYNVDVVSCLSAKELTYGESLAQLCKEKDSNAFYLYKQGHYKLRRKKEELN